MYGCAILLLLLIIPHAVIAEIYKYRDETGKWQFTDKKPKNAEAELVNYKSNKKRLQGPIFQIKDIKGRKHLSAKNPFHAPVQVELVSPQVQNQRQQWLIPPLATLVLLKDEEAIAPYQYRWYLGDPQVTTNEQLYQFPVQPLSCVHISQGFNGRFSHTKDHSRYAVDIAMNVGTSIVAARAGVVIAVKDDYHMGGVNEFFLDKGNYVSVLHEDGTFAMYGHILLGTAAVKAGDKVQAGQLLAKSGSSGFSSGPHLHFVISRNGGFRQLSLPFHFVTKNGNAIVPTEGMKICDQLVQR